MLLRKGSKSKISHLTYLNIWFFILILFCDNILNPGCSRQDSGSLIGEIVLNPEREEEERILRLRETWEEKQFARDVETKLRSFIEKHRMELIQYKI